MLIILAAWFGFSLFICLCLCRAAARPMPAPEEDLLVQAGVDETGANILAAGQPHPGPANPIPTLRAPVGAR